VDKQTIIYYDGYSSQPKPVEAWIDKSSSEVVLEKDDKVIRWAISALNVPEFSGANSITVQYGGFPPQSIEFLEKSPFGQALNAALPERTEGFKAFANRLVNGGFQGMLILSTVTISALILIYFYILPNLAEGLALSMDPKTEADLGQKMFEAFVDSSSINKEKTKKLRSFTQTLDFGSKDYNFQFHVVDEETVNAFAVPGGNIVVYNGLLKKIKSPEELAGLLGHEATHIKERHTLKQMARDYSGQVFLSIILGDVSSLSGAIIDNAHGLVNLKNSREMESSSDQGGLDILKKNKLNQRGMTDLLKTLMDEEKEMGVGEIPEYFLTHPLSKNRYTAAKAKISQTTNQNPMVMAAWEELKKD
jgi:beta-barrel assembly-enhancing protease